MKRKLRILKPYRAGPLAARRSGTRLNIITAIAFAALAMPAPALACACGCGVFDVGANVLTAMPTGANGATVWFRYDYMDQDHNWEHGSTALASDNQDKDINTSFYTFGGEYEINESWMVMAELPIYARQLETTDDGTVFGPAGGLYTGHLTDLGDMQLAATYTGFAPDQSSGVLFGVKLPTGNYTGPNGTLGGSEFDRDSLPGTGSTDVMLGGYHTGDFGVFDKLSYFIDGKYQVAVLTRDSYRPGNEFDSAAGLSYDFGKVAVLNDFAGILQFINSYRMHDTGAKADPLNSGYERLLIAPGITMGLRQFRVFADVEMPIHQYTNAASSLVAEGTSGQLVASAIYKFQIAYDF